jgi:hypothetical protein
MVQEPGMSNPTTSDWQLLLNKVGAFRQPFTNMRISDYASSSQITVEAYSSFSFGGNLYTMNNTTQTLSVPNSGFSYLYFRSTGTGSGVLEISQTAPGVYDANIGGWTMGSNTKALARIYKYNTNMLLSKVIDGANMPEFNNPLEFFSCPGFRAEIKYQPGISLFSFSLGAGLYRMRLRGAYGGRGGDGGNGGNGGVFSTQATGYGTYNSIAIPRGPHGNYGHWADNYHDSKLEWFHVPFNKTCIFVLLPGQNGSAGSKGGKGSDFASVRSSYIDNSPTQNTYYVTRFYSPGAGGGGGGGGAGGQSMLRIGTALTGLISNGCMNGKGGDGVNYGDDSTSANYGLGLSGKYGTTDADDTIINSSQAGGVGGKGANGFGVYTGATAGNTVGAVGAFTGLITIGAWN